MIDRENRNRTAELIRSLSSGLISNDEFEDKIPDSDDPAISEIFSHGAWCLYSDMKEYKLKGKDALCKADRSIIARWVLFLKSDIDYRWPSASFKESVYKAVTLGVFGQSTLDKWDEFGDAQYWPFSSKEQFESADKGYLGSTNT